MLGLMMLNPANTASAYNSRNLPHPESLLTDDAYILGKSAFSKLLHNAQRYQNKTGIQLTTIILNDLDGWKINDYIQWLNTHWQGEQKGMDNIALLFISVKEKQAKIVSGANLKTLLTPKINQDIITTKILPDFRISHMKGGVIKGHKAMISALNGKYKVPRPQTYSHRFATRYFIYSLFLICEIIVMIYELDKKLSHHKR